ncbi:MAG: carbamoyltransferase HypF, partial [Syntrophaceae bacterium]|nr:carbamoyltransferase HypF [Syntrophaceae bacterium]
DEEELTPRGEGTFAILASGEGVRGELHITPDTAVCDVCLAELFDPADRRYRYPFINCTDCGPRLTIIQSLPYDRSRTSMACFSLCPECRAEYEDPGNRRFHAEPNACPVCGPRLLLLGAKGEPLPGDPVSGSLALLREGKTLALKGLGGFHLACDAMNTEAVRRLRVRKCREKKPLALMVRNLETAHRLALVGLPEERLLVSPERPIVLCPRRDGGEVSPLVAPGMDTLGIMLPYTPFHHLLLAGDLPALVMTSGNRTDEPICIGNREALRRLAGIADAFVIHNRDILVRCDDSVAMAVEGRPCPIRRSRGYAPQPIPLAGAYPEVLALGGQDKNTLCIVKGSFAFPSPHIGDLETPEARDFLTETIDLMERITECRPSLVACDFHPGYHTSRLARILEGRQVMAVQHHHAHIVSGMAENGLTGPVIGLALDGTGYGTDAEAWGGECLVADEQDFLRAGHLRYCPLPGGPLAIREPWRMAAALLHEAYGPEWREWACRLDVGPEPAGEHGGTKKRASVAAASIPALDGLERSLDSRLPMPRTSSLGRFFDGVATLLGLRRLAGFEGQAAMELEALANGETDLRLPFVLTAEGSAAENPSHADTLGKPLPLTQRLILDLLPAIRTLAEALAIGRPKPELALAFHQLLPGAFTALAEAVRQETGLQRVVLSGGCFQNRRLLTGCLFSLSKAGFEVFYHHLVPTNDGGISLGQAVCAGARQEKGTLAS